MKWTGSSSEGSASWRTVTNETTSDSTGMPQVPGELRSRSSDPLGAERLTPRERAEDDVNTSGESGTAEQCFIICEDLSRYPPDRHPMAVATHVVEGFSLTKP